MFVASAMGQRLPLPSYGSNWPPQIMFGLATFLKLPNFEIYLILKEIKFEYYLFTYKLFKVLECSHFVNILFLPIFGSSISIRPCLP
jgi:hypothetical protein